MRDERYEATRLNSYQWGVFDNDSGDFVASPAGFALFAVGDPEAAFDLADDLNYLEGNDD